MKMLGRLGWGGQCSCCGTQRTKAAVRAYERRQWRRDWLEESRDTLASMLAYDGLGK